MKTVASVASILVILAAAGILAAMTTTLDGAQVYTLLAVIAGGTAVSGGLALGGTTSTNLIPHTVLLIAVLGLAVALAMVKVFDSGEVVGVFGFVLGGGAVGAGSVATSTQEAAAAAPAAAPPASVPRALVTASPPLKLTEQPPVDPLTPPPAA